MPCLDTCRTCVGYKAGNTLGKYLRTAPASGVTALQAMDAFTMDMKIAFTDHEHTNFLDILHVVLPCRN
jgi:hypothetical protein